jgi:hypothetical protein
MTVPLAGVGIIYTLVSFLLLTFLHRMLKKKIFGRHLLNLRHVLSMVRLIVTQNFPHTHTPKERGEN